MPTLASVMADLKSKASEKTRAIYIRHGAPPDRTLGVSVADMKLIVKTIKKQQALACELYATGIFDAMYLAGLVADGSQLTPKQLHAWAAEAAGMPMIFEYTVPWVALDRANPAAIALEWIAFKKGIRRRRRLVYLLGPAGHNARQRSQPHRNRSPAQIDPGKNRHRTQPGPLHHEQLRYRRRNLRRAAKEAGNGLRQTTRHSRSRRRRHRMRDPHRRRSHRKSPSLRPHR
jgi:DNA alkylation repair enzyme